MLKSHEGSTGRLVELCFWYFFFYVFTGIMPRYFRLLGVGDIEYAVWSTFGGMVLCLLVVFALGWYHFQSSQYITKFGIRFPKEFLYIIPSGMCTAVVIPTTTLLYSLGISVMVAQIIMRGCIIVISRLIDLVQSRQGILKKKVRWEEEVGVLIAIIAVSVQLANANSEDFVFLHNIPAMVILGSYLGSYTIRIYIMNYYKNTRPKDSIYDYKGFFSIEQIVSTVAILLFCFVLFYGSSSDLKQVNDFRRSFTNPSVFYLVKDTATLETKTQSLGEGKDKKEIVASANFTYPEGHGPQKIETISLPFWEMVGGMFFGAVAFFSVFIFMFQGRTATFAGLVNRLTSLLAGTSATILLYFMHMGKFPESTEWITFSLIIIALCFIARAEYVRNLEKSIPV